MNNKITTYEELQEHKKNLEYLLEAQGQLVKLEFTELKLALEPIQKTISNAADFITRDKKAWLINEAAGFVIDKLVKDLLLANTGWVTKNVIPELIKNYSSHFLANLQENLTTLLEEWLNKISENGEYDAKQNGNYYPKESSGFGEEIDTGKAAFNEGFLN